MQIAVNERDVNVECDANNEDYGGSNGDSLHTVTHTLIRGWKFKWPKDKLVSKHKSKRIQLKRLVFEQQGGITQSE